MFITTFRLYYAPPAMFKRLCRYIRAVFHEQATLSGDRKTLTVRATKECGRVHRVTLMLDPPTGPDKGISFRIPYELVEDKLMPDEKGEADRRIWPVSGVKFRVRYEDGHIQGGVATSGLAKKHELYLLDIIVEAFYEA